CSWAPLFTQVCGCVQSLESAQITRQIESTHPSPTAQVAAKFSVCAAICWSIQPSPAWRVPAGRQKFAWFPTETQRAPLRKLESPAYCCAHSAWPLIGPEHSDCWQAV